MDLKSVRLTLIIGTAILLSCAPAATQRPAAQTAADAPRAPQKSLTIALQWEPEALEPNLLGANPEIGYLTSAFLAYVTPRGDAKPYLAAELPSADKGTWRVLPDGTMTTTYKLVSNATWHDGQRITAQDFAFAYRVRHDPALPGNRLFIERKLANVTAIDDHTLLLDWKEPYYAADIIEFPNFAPLHRSLLEPVYTEDKPRFVDGAHWREQFVGSGPYRLERWEPGVELVFRAHEGFALGKPRIDHVVVRLVPDPNTIVANLLGGTTDAAFSYSIGFPHAQALEQVGWGGKVQYAPIAPRIIEFQTRDWGQAQKAAFDLRVRRAALHAIDRASIVDNIYAGKGLVVHFWLPPTDTLFPEADRVIRKYEFNPARAAALLEEAGWTKGGDGIGRNAAGEALDIPMQNQPNDFDQQEALVVADNWRAVGINTPIHRLAPHEMRDGQLRSTYPGVAYGRRGFNLESMVWTRAEIPGPENRWAGQNRSSYVNPTLEDLWPKVLGAIDRRERAVHLMPALQAMMDDAVVTLTHQQPNVMVFHADVLGPQLSADVNRPFWNVWEWSWK